MEANIGMASNIVDGMDGRAHDKGSMRDWTILREAFFRKVIPSVNDLDDFELVLESVGKIEEEFLFAESLVPRKKSREKYEEFKSLGNDSFRKKEYRLAIKDYNAAVLHAPDTSDYAVVLNNRAAAFFYNGDYIRAVADSISSLREGYPKENAGKVHERITKALEKLGISVSDDSSLDAVRAALNKFQKESQNKSTQISGKFPRKRKLLCNTRFDGLTAKADVKISPIVGRYVEATADLKVGEIVLDEKPFVSILSPMYYERFCQHCLKEIIAAVPCRQCSLVSFCSESCRVAATYHATECCLLEAIDKEVFCDYGLKACRFVTRVPLDKFLEETRHVFSVENGGETLYKRVLDSERHPELITPETCFRFSWITLFVIDLLRRVGYFGSDCQKPLKLSSKLADDESHIAKCIYRFLGICEYNTASVNTLDLNCKEYTYMHRGRGIYPSMNNLNHDCNANTVSVNIGNRVILIAVRPIKPGDQITLSYGPTFKLHSEKERQARLKRYGFRCTCECCTSYKEHSVESLAREVPLDGFKRFFCPNCKEVVKVNKRCSNCNTLLPDQKGLCLLYERFLSHFHELKRDDNSYKRIDEIPYLEKVISFLHGIHGNVSVEGMNAHSLYPYMLRYLAAITASHEQQRCIL